MGTTNLTTGAASAARPFDAALSLSLDDVIIQLDARPTGIRRHWLLLRKRWYERAVPAWYPEVR